VIPSHPNEEGVGVINVVRHCREGRMLVPRLGRCLPASVLPQRRAFSEKPKSRPRIRMGDGDVCWIYASPIFFSSLPSLVAHRLAVDTKRERERERGWMALGCAYRSLVCMCLCVCCEMLLPGMRGFVLDDAAGGALAYPSPRFLRLARPVMRIPPA